MKKTVILIGLGEMGGVFARAILRAGYPVYPVTRGEDIHQVAAQQPDPQAVVIAVGEKDIQNVLASLPKAWHGRAVLLQNELLPGDWLKHGLQNPTVISVWFEKKAGQDVKVIIPSPVYGPLSDLVQTSLKTLNIACTVLSTPEDLLFELVMKNLYILTVNIAGLEVGGTVGELWKQHRALAEAVAGDVLDIQFKLIGRGLDRKKLTAAMVKAFDGDPQHKCLGRTAPARLSRAINQADQFGLEVGKLREIYQQKERAVL